MHLIGTVLSVAALFSATTAFWGNRWVRHCRAGHTRRIRNADCDEFGRKGMSKCLGVTKHDRTIAAAIRRCPNQLPRTNYSSYAYKLFINNLPRAFRAYIAGGRCKRLSDAMKERLLGGFVDNNSVPFVRAMIQHCALSHQAWDNFTQRAQLQGKNELLVVLRGANISPYQSGGAASFGGGGPGTFGFGNTNPQLGPVIGTAISARYLDSQQTPGGTVITDRQSYSQGSAMAGTFRGDPLYANPDMVAKNVNILAQLSPPQANRFGLLSEGCMALTEAHFRQPGVSSDVVGNLPLHCFQLIPPQAFAGLTAPMVARLQWWPFVTRDQVRYVQTGAVIRAVPFDQLGKGRQRDREDREHPCWTITHDQLRSIRKSSRAYREYKRRCVRSVAPRNAISIGVLATAGLFGAYMLI